MEEYPLHVVIVGFLAMGASLVISLVGLPRQIWRNFKKGKCEGIDPLFVYTGAATYTLWSVYSWLRWDPFLIVAQTMGSVLCWIWVIQLLVYRGNQAKTPKG